jgi:glycosyltransferase involved in cell wall biosynthesis
VGIRVLVIDDNPHVSWQGRTYPVNATFHRFLSAVLDVTGAPVASIVHAVPLRPAREAPQTLPLDERLDVVGTTPFDGIAGFLRRAREITGRNAPVLRAALDGADLLWLKVPASNAFVAGWLAWRAGVPRFGYVAGSAREVARGRHLGLPSQAVGFAYDIAGLVAASGHRVVVGAHLIEGAGIVTSLVDPDEIRDPRRSTWPHEPGRLRLIWAGRLTAGKGIETLLEALSHLDASVTLDLVGDGPARGDFEARAEALGTRDRVTFVGYVAERGPYLQRLAAADLFVFPSSAEGFPKVILDALAVGLPVLASPAGALRDLGGAGVIQTVRAGDASLLREAIVRLVAEPDLVAGLRQRGNGFVAIHTAPAEAARLVESWRADFPHLPWGAAFG